MSRKVTFDESFERALKATNKNGGDDLSKSRAFRETKARNASVRRFIGDCQLDLKYRRMATDEKGAVRPWYIVQLSVGRMKHKFSLGGAANWSKYSSPLDDELVADICQAAVRFALDEEDDDIPDHVTETVRKATNKALKDDAYEVRKTI